MATPTTLPVAAVAGDVLTAAYVNDLRGAFRVLQVVYAEHSTQAANSTTTYADTGLTATITPSSTSSKVLVLINQGGVTKTSTDAGNGTNLRLVRTATTINTFGTNVGLTSTTVNLEGLNVACIDLDDPATTSAVTYKTTFANRVAASLVAVQTNSATSTMVLMEVSA
jgi:hypothetical protein